MYVSVCEFCCIDIPAKFKATTTHWALPTLSLRLCHARDSINPVCESKRSLHITVVLVFISQCVVQLFGFNSDQFVWMICITPSKLYEYPHNHTHTSCRCGARNCLPMCRRNGVRVRMLMMRELYGLCACVCSYERIHMYECQSVCIFVNTRHARAQRVSRSTRLSPSLSARVCVCAIVCLFVYMCVSARVRSAQP